jgi:predicted GNAT superfamily acetyltransferase
LLHDRRVLVEIPMGFGEMQVREPELALAWRLSTREIFQAYFGNGFRAVDFFLSRESRRGHYLLARHAE